MKKMLLATLTGLLIVVMTLFAMLVLVQASLAVAAMTHPALRALAVAAELILGVVLLVGTIYLATHLAVRIFGGKPTDYPPLDIKK